MNSYYEKRHYTNNENNSFFACFYRVFDVQLLERFLINFIISLTLCPAYSREGRGSLVL